MSRLTPRNLSSMNRENGNFSFERSRLNFSRDDSLLKFGEREKKKGAAARFFGGYTFHHDTTSWPGLDRNLC